MTILSDRKIRDLKPGDTDRWISDGGGLYIRVRVPGVRDKSTKTWVIRRKRSGKTAVETIGEFPEMSCAAARAVLARRSTNPNLERITFGDLLDEWYQRQIEPRYRVTKNIQTYVNRTKAEFGALSISRISTVALVRWLQKYAEITPVAANRCSSTLKLALNYAVECGYLDRNPLQAVTLRVIGGEETIGKRTLCDDELRQLWAWPGAKASLLRLLLLTGLRISEGQQGYQDGDLWRIDWTKNKSSHWVYLTEMAKTQLTEPFNTTPTNVQSWLQRKQKAAENAWTPHDLRRTFATRLAGLGIAPHIIEKCLNHRMQGMLAIYNHEPYEADRIAAAKLWANELARIVNASGSLNHNESTQDAP